MPLIDFSISRWHPSIFFRLNGRTRNQWIPGAVSNRKEGVVKVEFTDQEVCGRRVANFQFDQPIEGQPGGSIKINGFLVSNGQ